MTFRLCSPLKHGFLSLALAASAIGGAQAADYPSQPVKLVVAYAAGGGTDALARVVAERLGPELKGSIIVDNKPGAGGTIAADLVAKSPPDGHTLLITDTQYVISPSLMTKMPFDAKKDLVPVTLMTAMPLYLVVKSDSSIKSLNDLIARSKAEPGKFDYGSAGVGSLHHIAMESFKSSLKLDIVHVPYRGSGLSIAGFLAGDVDVLVASMASIAAHVKAGTARVIAATSPTRAPNSPDVPSISDVVPGYDFTTEIGLFAPAGTPKDVIAKLSGALVQTLKMPAVSEKVNNDMGASVVASTPEAYTRSVHDNLDRYAQAVKVSGAKVE